MAKHTEYLSSRYEIGQRIKQLQGSRTASEFAKIIGCERKKVYAIHKGTSTLTDYQIVTLCTYFNVSADWLLFGKE